MLQNLNAVARGDGGTVHVGLRVRNLHADHAAVVEDVDEAGGDLGASSSFSLVDLRDGRGLRGRRLLDRRGRATGGESERHERERRDASREHVQTAFPLTFQVILGVVP